MRARVILFVGFFLLSTTLLVSCNPPVTDITVACSAADLVNAIQTANNSPTTQTTLHLTPDCIYDLTTIETYDTDIHPAGVGTPAIISPIVIDGQAATIRRSGALDTPEFRLFLINPGASLSIDRVYLKNGKVIDGSGYGGAILNYGELSITTSDILENQAHQGGAIYTTGTFSTLWSVYYNNLAEYMGGAIQNNGAASLDRSIFHHNQAYYGGALANHTGTAEVNGSHFDDNIAALPLKPGLGGAISNTSTSPAAADVGKMHVFTSTFDNNQAGLGGAVANMNYSEIMLRESSLTNNTADRGGALLNYEEADITRCTFSGNSASDFGGAIYFYDTDDSMGIPCGNSTFSGNRITGGNAQGGSAIYQIAGGSGFRHVTITENSDAAAFVVQGGISTMQDAIIAMNPGGDCGGSAIGTVYTTGYINMDGDGSCPGFTYTDNPMLDPLADNGGDTMTHALQEHSPALDKATDSSHTIDQRLEPRPYGDANDLGAFESQEFSGDLPPMIQQITAIPELIITIPVPEEPQKEPDLYWEFEGFVCSEIGLTEFYMRTSSPPEVFSLTANDKPIACYQQNYDKERYWCHVEKAPLGWNIPTEIIYCEGKVCETITRTTLSESRCSGPAKPDEPEKVSCNLFSTKADCSAAPGCSWVCSSFAAANLCSCQDSVP